jgi:hypothetical protein
MVKPDRHLMTKRNIFNDRLLDLRGCLKRAELQHQLEMAFANRALRLKSKITSINRIDCTKMNLEIDLGVLNHGCSKKS